MPTSTRKQANAPRKHIPGKRGHENQEKKPLPIKKHIKPVKFQYPDEIIISSPPIVTSSPSSPTLSPKELEDVSQHEYTLAKSVMLDSVSIYADSLIVKPGEFNYRNWEIEAMR